MTYKGKKEEETPRFVVSAVEKNKKAKQMVSDYVKNFTSSSLWLEAEREAWSLPLWRYVHAVASTQSQMIEGVAVGWNKADIMGINYPLSDQELYSWMERQKQQAIMGYIDVMIPTGKINEWKLEYKKQEEICV